MNTYDPADHIHYVRMARESDPYATPVTSTGSCNRLPVGYANKPPRTHVTGCTRQTTASTSTTEQHSVVGGGHG